MEKLYDLKFVYDDESLKTERFTGEFSTDNLPDEILNVLMHTNHFSYKKEGRIIRLSLKNKEDKENVKKRVCRPTTYLFKFYSSPISSTNINAGLPLPQCHAGRLYSGRAVIFT